MDCVSRTNHVRPLHLFWALSICLFSYAKTIEAALILISLIGLLGAIIGSLNMGLTQLLVPDNIRGRMISIMIMTYSFMPIGLIPISSLTENYGITSAIMRSGTLVGLSPLKIRLSYRSSIILRTTLPQSQRVNSLLPMSQTTFNHQSIDIHYNLQIGVHQPHLYRQPLFVYEIQNQLGLFGHRSRAQICSA